MKITTLATYLLLLFACIANSQKQSKAAHKCHLGHKCEAKESYDEFKKLNVFSDETRLTSLANDSKTVVLKKVVKDGKETFVLIFGTTHSACISPVNTKVILLFEDRSTIELPYEGRVDCGAYYITCIASKEEMQKISESPINKVRMDFADDRQEYAVSEKNQAKLMEKARCISLIQ